MKNLTICLFTIILMVSCKTDNTQKKERNIAVNYPETKTADSVDTYFGNDVKDPYRWLEDDMSEETGEWVKAQNEVTFGYLDTIPFRKELKERLEKMWLLISIRGIPGMQLNQSGRKVLSPSMIFTFSENFNII